MEKLFSIDEGPGLIGAVIGGYRVTGVLGAGAMGKVYRAEAVDRGTPVALKVLHSFLSASKEAAARFRREAFVGVKLVHPNCVPVLDAGTAEDGSVYLAMELIPGESLGDLLDRERRLPWRRALHIARHVLRGLDHAHRESVVHRDIKPDNIFITPRDDDPDFARILDFGIAKLVGDVGGQAITQAGISVGTPSYLSPEQAMGIPLDGRSDLYSLSIVLYEMLTGATPFGHLEPLKRLLAHVAEPVPAFEAIAPGLEIPPEVEALVRDGLAKKPDDRIGSAAEYLVRIEPLLAPPPREAPVIVAAPEVSAVARPARPPRRVALVAAIAIAVVAAIGVAAWLVRGDDPPQLVHTGTIAPPPPEPPPLPAEVQAAIDALETGKTCQLRRKAVERLASLGDPAAIPHLEKARSRPYKGKNANACLVAAVKLAIEKLRK
jgi:serine/threonine-protein kinase